MPEPDPKVPQCADLAHLGAVEAADARRGEFKDAPAAQGASVDPRICEARLDTEAGPVLVLDRAGLANRLAHAGEQRDRSVAIRSLELGQVGHERSRRHSRPTERIHGGLRSWWVSGIRLVWCLWAI